jgi:outer membrane protein assembly factor BamA
VNHNRQLLIFLFSMLIIAITPAYGDALSADSTGPSSLSLFPIVFTTPETGFGGGGGLVYTRQVQDAGKLSRSNSIQFFGFYTTKNQSAAIITSELYLADQKLFIESMVSYGKMPTLYYGLGNFTRVEDEEEYTYEAARLRLTPQYRILPGLRLGATLILEKANIYALEAQQLLDTNRPIGTDGGANNGLGPLVSWDTRDNAYYPHGGHFCLAKVRFFGKSLGGDYSYTDYSLDLRKFIPIAPGHYLALQGYLRSAEGDVPFYHLAQLGGILRGLIETRYTDRSLASAQMEYRFPLPRYFNWMENFRGSLFVGSGQVARELDDMTKRALKTTAGCGLRYALDRRERIHIRFDIGFGEGNTEIYFQFMEAF